MTGPGPDRLGLLVVAGPGEAGRRWLEGLPRILAAGTEVFLYLVDRAVLHLASGDIPDPPPEGLRLHACAFGSRRYGVPLKGAAVFCGLTVLHNIVIGCAGFRTVPAPPPIDTTSPGPPTGGAGSPSGRRVREIVVRIRHDPRTSHLPVEGLRIAAGMTIGAEPVTVWLDPPAASLTDLPADAVVDGERRDAYLDILSRRSASIGPGPLEAAVAPGPVAGVRRILTI